MIPPHGLVEWVEHMRTGVRMTLGRGGGVRELEAWLGGWNTHRLRGAERVPGTDKYFFDKFEPFVRERYKPTAPEDWSETLLRVAGSNEAGLALFFELWDAFSEGFPKARPRPEPVPVAFRGPPDVTLNSLFELYMEKPETRPGDGSVAALDAYLQGFERAAPHAWTSMQRGRVTQLLQAQAEDRTTTDWSVLLAPLTQAGEEPFAALFRIFTAMVAHDQWQSETWDPEKHGWK